MTNPNNAVGTNAAYNGRTSVNAFNDDLALLNRGIISGWACAPDSGLSVVLGGSGTTRDVAVAEDNIGNKTSINNISGSPIQVTIGPAPAADSRIDLIVAYVDNPPTGTSTVADNYGACGLIVVAGTPASTPTVPDDNAIRTAIVADGASGATAYYVVLAQITIASGTTDIDATMIQQGAQSGVGTSNILNGAVTADKIDFTTLIEKVGTADNYALKYADGTMICCQRISCTTDTVETWGSLYNVLLKPSNVLYAVEFYSLPTISVTYESSGVNGMLTTRYQSGYPTKAHAGTYTVARPKTSSTGSPAILHIIAIGRWKA